MKYANELRDIPNAFDALALNGESEFKAFYYNGTMPVRTGDPYISPIADIYEDCVEEAPKHTFLLLGNRGCGKSTELNVLSRKLRVAGHKVTTVECGHDMNLKDPLYTDLLFLMGEAMLTTAKQLDCPLDEKTSKTLSTFFQKMEKVTKMTDDDKLSMDCGVNFSIPFFSAFFGQVKQEAHSRKEVQTTYRESIRASDNDWKEAMNYLADAIARHSDHHSPVLIFEDLDKLLRTEVWNVFYSDAPKLADFRFPIIYTFRSAFRYDPRFNSSMLSHYFKLESFPVIHLEKQDGSRNEDGFSAIREIVQKRASLVLFDTDPASDRNALDYLIEKTGGSLRDLFAAINGSFHRARRRRSTRIEREDAEAGLAELRNNLSRQIDRGDYEILCNICHGDNQKIQDRERLLRFLEQGILIEHNGWHQGHPIFWHSVHPIITDYLKEMGALSDV